jgi:hypothetical protein
MARQPAEVNNNPKFGELKCILAKEIIDIFVLSNN